LRELWLGLNAWEKIWARKSTCFVEAWAFWSLSEMLLAFHFYSFCEGNIVLSFPELVWICVGFSLLLIIAKET
jgi:hypothetical protein